MGAVGKSELYQKCTSTLTSKYEPSPSVYRQRLIFDQPCSVNRWRLRMGIQTRATEKESRTTRQKKLFRTFSLLHLRLDTIHKRNYQSTNTIRLVYWLKIPIQQELRMSTRLLCPHLNKPERLIVFLVDTNGYNFKMVFAYSPCLNGICACCVSSVHARENSICTTVTARVLVQ